MGTDDQADRAGVESVQPEAPLFLRIEKILDTSGAEGWTRRRTSQAIAAEVRSDSSWQRKYNAFRAPSQERPEPWVQTEFRNALQERPQPNRLRLAAERVIASFDWQDGPLPIITDDSLAFGNAVNRLRDALGVAQERPPVQSDE